MGILTLLGVRHLFYEYAFLQAGAMIPLILITENQKIINVRLAVERSLGSLNGGLVAIVMVYVSAYSFSRTVKFTDASQQTVLLFLKHAVDPVVPYGQHSILESR